MIFVDQTTDSAVVLFLKGDLQLPKSPITLMPVNQPCSIGSDIGWLGYPAIEPNILCFFAGTVSAGLHNDKLILPFKKRLALLRAAGRRVYNPSVFKQFDRVLGKVANAHGARAPFIHGRFIPYTNRRFVIENHRHSRKDGIWRVEQKWCSVQRLSSAAARTIDAAASFVAFNRQHLPGSPPSWLDIPRPPYKKPAPKHRRANPNHTNQRKQPAPPRSSRA